MSFLATNFLWLLPLAAIPVILYLLFRRRRQEVDWGATYILRLALASGRRQTLWKQLLIIALRTVLMLLLVLAFARPFRPWRPETDRGFPRGRDALHRIILLDNSLSMEARRGLASRLDEGREALAELLTATRAGDVCEVIPMCPEMPGGDPEIRFVDTPCSPATAREVAAAVRPRATALRFADALRLAVESFRNAAAPDRQLIIVTDLAATDHPDSANYTVFGDLLDQLDARVAVLDLGRPEPLNLAIESLDAGTELLLAGQPTNVYATVMNYSRQSATDGRIQFYVDGEPRTTQPCILPAGHRRTFAFAVTLGPGEHSVEARLGEDAYEADNQAQRFVVAAERLRLLVVTPASGATDGFRRPEAFLSRALESGEGQPYRIDAEFLSEEMLLPRALEGQDAVILAGISRLNTTMAGALAAFVRRGGGLLVAAGPELRPETLNGMLGELLPARIDAPARATFDEDRFTTPQPADIDLAILREFEAAENGDLSRARVYNHVRLTEDALPADSRVLLRLINGDPLLLDRPFGRGRVLLWTTSLGGAWSSLPVRQAYVPFVYRLLNYAAAFGRWQRNVAPGTPLIATVPTEGGELFAATPDARLEPLERLQADDGSFVRVEETAAPGTWQIVDGDGKGLASFTVTMPLTESDLRVLEDDARDELGDLLGARFATDTEGLRLALWREGDGHEYAAFFLLGALALLLLDALLTRIFFA